MKFCDNYIKVKFKSKDILFYAFSLLWLQMLFLFLTKWGIVIYFHILLVKNKYKKIVFIIL